MLKINILFLSVLCLHACSAYKILVIFPMPANSHAILGAGFVKHLLKAGHEVTFVTSVPMKPQNNLHQVDVSSNFQLSKKAVSELLNLSNILVRGNNIEIRAIMDHMFIFANETLFHPEVQKLINDPEASFDAVIAEWMYTELYSGFAALFDCPLIWSSSQEPHDLVLELIHEAPNPAYNSNSMAVTEPPFSITQRISELGVFIKLRYYRWMAKSLHEETFVDAFKSAAKKRGRELPALDIAKYSGSLMFGNSHFSFGQAVSLPQNYIHIGGYHIEETVKPLPEDLQKLLDSSTNGVIYFSMGSNLKSSSFPDTMKRELLNIFGGLKQTVIWKFEEVLADQPKNVHVVQWAPQQSILAHPNCVLFITHGGLLSITESLHHGVPIIGIPMFADQYVNVERAVNRGFALQVTPSYNIPQDLGIAVKEILSNPKYAARMKQLSSIYHDRPQRPGDSLVYWTEYVIRTRGAPHLRSPALFNTWYEKMYLDILGIILVTIIALRIAFKKFLALTKDNKVKLS